MDNNINRHLPSHVSGASSSTPSHPGNNSPLTRAHAGPSRSIQHTDSLSRRQQPTGNHPLANATAGSSLPRARGTHFAHPAQMRNTDTTHLQNAALDVIRRGGLIWITDKYVHLGYQRPVRISVAGRQVSHVIASGSLGGALRQVMGRLRHYPNLAGVQSLAALSDSLAANIIKSTLDSVMAADNLHTVNSTIGTFCNYRNTQTLGFNRNTIGNRDFITIPLPDALHTLVGRAKERARIAPDATACSPDQLQHYKLELFVLLADYSVFELQDKLRTNLANIFVQRHTEIGDKVMGINIKAIVETEKMQDTVKAIDGGGQPLGEVMATYLGNLQNQHAQLVATLPFKDTVQKADRIAAGARLADGLSVHEAQIKLVLQKLEGPQPPVEAVRAELKSIVFAYEDSFRFDYAKGPHHELNRDMNAVMGPIFTALQEFSRSPRSVPVTTLIPSLKQMIEAHNNVLRNFGVPEPQLKKILYTTQESTVALIRHILLDTPLPSGFVPYKCTQKHEFLDVLPRFDGGALRIRAGSTAAVHQDYTGEEYENLLEQVAVEFLLQHSQAQVDRMPHPLTHAFRFDHEGRGYQFAYRIETDCASGKDHITQAQLSVFSPNKINEKIIVKLMPPEYRWPQLDGPNPQGRR